MARDSLCVWKWVNALSGIGVARGALFRRCSHHRSPPLEDACVDDPGRVVPLADVFALEEMPVLELAVVSTVALAVDDDVSAELLFTLDTAVVVLPVLEANVGVGGCDTPLVADGVNRALPVDAVAPAPAPEDEPAVFDTMVVEGLALRAD